MIEIVFVVEDASEGGFRARAIGASEALGLIV